VLACGPLSPASSTNTTSVPAFICRTPVPSTLFRVKVDLVSIGGLDRIELLHPFLFVEVLP
jgi:hypothetical protein